METLKAVLSVALQTQYLKVETNINPCIRKDEINREYDITR